MYYFIQYEYEGKVYESTVQPHENVIDRLMSLTDAGAKITDIKEQKALWGGLHMYEADVKRALKLAKFFGIKFDEKRMNIFQLQEQIQEAINNWEDENGREFSYKEIETAWNLDTMCNVQMEDGARLIIVFICLMTETKLKALVVF